ncbi:hypothetical protein GYMLUDRAFT_253663 [Collybiopsis luxurians FD-317 M1]|uniref:Tc1-like transposase DDE domain-containing protein n=1 Tax=Collybiopsis luxurians FD-317 M1 TaxID=944289 RepID=A0A0D0BVX4_9AGAR|nr:hypothetical protein GYMLUDRAFT_253663 [Collybiopsis luxurians FD-317 M1]
MLSDQQAANKVFDLEALRRYNDLRLELIEKREAWQKKIASAPSKIRPLLEARQPKILSAQQASQKVAYGCGKGPAFAKHLRNSANYILRTGLLPENCQGQGAAHASLLNDIRVSSKLRLWSDGLIAEEEGGWVNKLRPEKLRRYVNEFLFPSLGIESTISISTATSWLKKLGFRLARHKKGVYVDGHERPDVVVKRSQYAKIMFEEIFPFCTLYDGPDLVKVEPSLKSGEKLHRVLYQDETCFHANDQCNSIWVKEDEQPIRDKSRGRVVHVSDFIIADSENGRLALTEEEIGVQMRLPVKPPCPNLELEPAGHPNSGTKKPTQKVAVAMDRTFDQAEWIPPPPPDGAPSYRLSSFDARRIIYPGSNGDAWWDMPQLIAQTKAALDIFEAKFPGDIAVFVFDCSSAHEAFPSDALLAHKMNRGPGGAQPKMHDTVNPMTGETQRMVWPMNYTGRDSRGKSLAGQAKGMEQVCLERGLLEVLSKENKGKVLAICSECRKSQAARDKAAKEAKARSEEIEGSGMPDLASRGSFEGEEEDIERVTTCCMQRLLSSQPDFMVEKPLLQIVIERRGHKCLFLPKFHCELNPIEMVWGQAKRRFREMADGTFPRAKVLVPESLDKVSAQNIRRYFRHCDRYLDAYR